MDKSLVKKHLGKRKRALRVRSRLRGSSEKPRLCVIRTNKHIHAQLIDDDASVTLVSTSTISKDFRGSEFGKKNQSSAKELGKKMAELAIGKNVKKVVFDRGPFKYHGIVAAFADGAREGGLEV